MLTREYSDNKTSVINDPLGQTHYIQPVAITILTKNCFVLRDFEKWNGRSCVKIVITTCRDCGLAEWINLS